MTVGLLIIGWVMVHVAVWGGLIWLIAYLIMWFIFEY